MLVRVLSSLDKRLKPEESHTHFLTQVHFGHLYGRDSADLNQAYV